MVQQSSMSILWEMNSECQSHEPHLPIPLVFLVPQFLRFSRMLSRSLALNAFHNRDLDSWLLRNVEVVFGGLDRHS
jgi:hypothetical protein